MYPNSLLKKDYDTEDGLMNSPDPLSNKWGAEYSRFKIVIPDFNILKWDVNKYNFDEQQKNFLINLSLYYESVNYDNPNYKNTYYNSSKILINRLQAHITPDDLVILIKTFNKQMEDYWGDNKVIFSKVDDIFQTLPSKYKKETQIKEKNDEEEISETKQKIYIEDAEILFLNVLKEKEEKGLSPFLKIIMKMAPFSIKSVIRTKKIMTCYLELFILFYNPFSNKTEPLLEKTPFLLDFVKSPEGISYFTFQLSQAKETKENSNKKSRMNINISEDMLAVFYKVQDLWLKKLDFSNNEPKTPLIQSKPQTPRKLSKETSHPHYKKKITSRKFANSYSIKNETGYDLKIRKYNVGRIVQSNEKSNKLTAGNVQNYVEIKNGETIEFKLEGDENSFEQNFSQPVKVYVEFTSYSGKTYFLQNITVNRSRTQQNSWKSVKLAKENILKLFFICHTKLKESKTKLTISSPIIFINSVNQTFYLKVISEDFPENKDYIISPNKRKPIPLEYAENHSMFCLRSNLNPDKIEKDIDENSKFFTFWSLKSEQAKRGFEVKEANFFYLLRSRIGSFPNKFEISIESIFKFKNCLPMQLELEFFTKRIKEEKVFPLVKLNCQETFLYHYSSINEPVFMRLKLPGFQKSDDILVFSNNMTKTTQKLPLFSENTEGKDEIINLYLFYMGDEIKVQEIFIYAKGCIINETKKDLLFYSIKTFGQPLEILSKIKLGKGLLPGQFSDPPSQIILFDETTEIAISQKEFPNELSSSIPIKGVGEIRAEIKVLGNVRKSAELIEFAVNISSKCSGISYPYNLFKCLKLI